MKVSSGDGGAEGMGVDGLIESNWDQVTESFDDMGLHQQLLRGIYGYGFEKPSGKSFFKNHLLFSSGYQVIDFMRSVRNVFQHIDGE